MLKIENTEVIGWKAAIRGMRNPLNSWEKSDSVFDIEPDADFSDYYGYDLAGKLRGSDRDFDFSDIRGDIYTVVGPNDLDLMKRLAANGPVHAKYRRMITVYCDVTAPLYWWKEFDTYKVGTVRNSCSTMHKITSKVFTLDDFSHEHLTKMEDVDDEKELFVSINVNGETCLYSPAGLLKMTCQVLNAYRKKYLETMDKRYWWQLIQLLPSSYNQRATVMLNYEVLAGIYQFRKDHKLDCWHTFCDWIKSLPYSEVITGEKKEG